MARSKSSGRWLREHFDDPYVKRAQHEGWRSRAVYKLQELQEKYRIIQRGMTVVDLGAAPGGWSQYALDIVGREGRVIALDILPMDPIEHVRFIQGDFTERAPLDLLETELNRRQVDLVMSDMAPNISGMKAVDQPRSMYLAELAQAFALQWLKPGGTFLVKVFQGQGSDAFLRSCRDAFDKMVVRKPGASRPRSREVYMLGTGRKLN